MVAAGVIPPDPKDENVKGYDIYAPENQRKPPR
jgi:hypothetical protein